MSQFESDCKRSWFSPRSSSIGTISLSLWDHWLQNRFSSTSVTCFFVLNRYYYTLIASFLYHTLLKRSLGGLTSHLFSWLKSRSIQQHRSCSMTFKSCAKNMYLCNCDLLLRIICLQLHSLQYLHSLCCFELVFIFQNLHQVHHYIVIDLFLE